MIILLIILCYDTSNEMYLGHSLFRLFTLRLVYKQ